MPRARVLTASATARTKKGRQKLWHINGQSASATARTKNGQAPTTCAGACRRQIAACMRQPINTDTTALPCPLFAKILAGMAGGKVTLCHPCKRLVQGAGGLLGWWSGFVVASLNLSAWRVLLQICIKFGKNMQHSRTLRKSYLEILVTCWLIAAFLQNGWKFHCQYYCTGISSFFAQIILIDILISSRICWNQSFSPILVGRATWSIRSSASKRIL